MKLLRRLPPTCPAQATDASHLDDFPDDATYEFRARRAEITKDGEFRERPAQALNITKDGTPVLFQQSQEVKSLAQQFCSHRDKNDYAKCGGVLKKIKTAIQKSTTAGPNPDIEKIITFKGICHELEIPSWKYVNYYIELYEYERWQAAKRRRESFDERLDEYIRKANDGDETHFCGRCGNRLPDEETFRKIVVRCYKEGFDILGLDGISFDEVEGEFCVCKNRIMSRLSSIHRRRSRVKRMVALLLARYLKKDHLAQYVRKDRLDFYLRSGSSLLERGDKPPKDRSKRKALQRQWRSEDLILWDVELAAFYDSDGKPHCVEKVLDTPLVRDLVKPPPRSLRERALRVIDLLVDYEGLVSHLTRPVEEPLNPLDGELSPDLERLWRARLNE